VALHSLETHPDVGLDVLHDVANVEVTVGVRQGGGDEKLALRHLEQDLWAKGSILVPAESHDELTLV
jgi:hypothetical protein